MKLQFQHLFEAPLIVTMPTVMDGLEASLPVYQERELELGFRAA